MGIVSCAPVQKMGIVSCAPVLFAVLLHISRSVLGQCSGNFSETCSSLQLVGISTLQALCGDEQDGFETSTLDLDAHITNSNGKLACSSDGDFSASCQAISLDSFGTLSADCFDVSGNLLQTSVDLNGCVQNANGNLKWACV